MSKKIYDAVLFTDITHTVLAYKPLGAHKIAHILREQGYRALVVDHMHTWNIKEMKRLMDNVISDQTEILGFHTTFFSHSNVKETDKGKIFLPMDHNVSIIPQGIEFEIEMFEYARSLNKNIKVVCGGSNDTRMSLSNPRVDFAVVGYAENSIVHLMKHLKEGTDIPKLYTNPQGVKVIDDRTALGYDFEKDHMIWDPSDVISTKCLPIEMARGCIFNCKFCRHPMRGRRKVDFVRSTGSIAEELQRNYDEYGISTYMIVDDTFNDNEEKMLQIRDAVQKLSFTPTMWSYTRLDLLAVRPQRIKIMHDIGVRSMFFGIETLTERVGHLIGKGYDREQQIKTIRKIKNEYGEEIQMHGSFIIGLPGETLEEIDTTAQQLKSGEIPLSSWNFNALVLAKDTGHAWNAELSSNYEKYGYRVGHGQNKNMELKHVGDWDPNAIPWESDVMNFEKARNLVEDYMTEYHDMDKTIGGEIGFGLLQYPTWNWDRVKNTTHKTIQWDKVSFERKLYTQQYKKRFLQYVSAE